MDSMLSTGLLTHSVTDKRPSVEARAMGIQPNTQLGNPRNAKCKCVSMNHSFVNYQVLGKGCSLRTSVITAGKPASESLSSMSLCQQIKVVYGQKRLYPSRKRSQHNKCLSGFILVKKSNKGTSQTMRKVTRFRMI